MTERRMDDSFDRESFAFNPGQPFPAVLVFVQRGNTEPTVSDLIE
jgi:hypothetical protein